MKLLACDMGGNYITYNAGETWRIFNLRDAVSFFLFDPIDPNVVYAKAAVLYRSADKGKTWKMLLPRPTAIEKITTTSDAFRRARLTKAWAPGMSSRLASDAYGANPTNATRRSEPLRRTNAGGPRKLNNVTVTLSSWACVSYRPSASSKCGGGRWYSSGLKQCFNSLADDVTSGCFTR